MKLLYSIFFFVLIFSGCGGNESPNSATSTNEQADNQETTVALDPIIQIDTNLTAFANFLAADTSLLRFQDSNLLNEYLKWMEGNQAKYEKIRLNRLEKIGNWNAENLSQLKSSDTSFLFYPLAGGDFIHMNFLFPKANNYLMLALEPVGSIPNLNGKINHKDISYLMHVDNVLRNIYRQSYFVTKNMDADMSNSKYVDGVLPLLLWGMGKTDHSIVSLNYFDIDSSGSKVDAKTSQKPTGVRIEFIKNGTTKIKSVEYLSVNIVNSSIKKNPEIKSYLMKTVSDQCNSFIKSASYILHYKSFSEMRGLILSKTKYHLQDDTGIPFKYFDSTFNASLFGDYVIPVEDFDPQLFQKDLDKAYKDSLLFKGELPFSMGYHWGTRKQNQMVFSKTN